MNINVPDSTGKVHELNLQNADPAVHCFDRPAPDYSVHRVTTKPPLIADAINRLYLSALGELPLFAKAA